MKPSLHQNQKEKITSYPTDPPSALRKSGRGEKTRGGLRSNGFLFPFSKFPNKVRKVNQKRRKVRAVDPGRLETFRLRGGVVGGMAGPAFWVSLTTAPIVSVTSSVRVRPANGAFELVLRRGQFRSY